MDKKTVLSLSPSREALRSRETALCNGGMKVISVMTEVQARFEITMGACGVLLICYRLSESDAEDVTQLYRKYCPKGRIVFVTEPSKGKSHAPAGSDFIVPESGGPELILKALNGAR